MNKILSKIYRIVSGLWLGSILFFSGVIAPQIFKLLPKAEAANIQGHLFPIYYILGSLCGFTLFGLDLFLGKKKIFYIALATAIAVLGFSVLSPMISEASLAQDPSIKWLHPLAVILNVIMLVCVLIAV